MCMRAYLCPILAPKHPATQGSTPRVSHIYVSLFSSHAGVNVAQVTCCCLAAAMLLLQKLHNWLLVALFFVQFVAYSQWVQKSARPLSARTGTQKNAGSDSAAYELSAAVEGEVVSRRTRTQKNAASDSVAQEISEAGEGAVVWVAAAMAYFLGRAAFFMQGNSNSPSTIDISGAYTGCVLSAPLLAYGGFLSFRFWGALNDAIW